MLLLKLQKEKKETLLKVIIILKTCFYPIQNI